MTQKVKYNEAKTIWLNRLKILTNHVDHLTSSSTNDLITKTTLEYVMKLNRLVTFDEKLLFNTRQNIYLYIKHYFKTYCGIKDQMMISYNGECHRQYHQQSHQDYFHVRRGLESVHTSGHPLTYCSIDGIDYEYTQLNHKYKKYFVSVFIVDNDEYEHEYDDEYDDDDDCFDYDNDDDDDDDDNEYDDEDGNDEHLYILFNNMYIFYIL